MGAHPSFQPTYKDHRLVAKNLLRHKRYGDFSCKWLDNHLRWRPVDEFALSILCEANADIEQTADTLGRKPTTLARRARDVGFTIPTQWAKLIAPKGKPVLAARATNYPYIIKRRDEHADLMAVNAVIPAAIPDNMRADICQEIMLAILEGRTTIEMLKSRKGNSTYFIKKFYHDNYEHGGHAISFNGTKEDWSSDAVSSSIAAKEWHREQFVDQNGYTGTLKTFTPPTQFEAAWRDQIGRIQMRQHELGYFLSAEEVETMTGE